MKNVQDFIWVKGKLDGKEDWKTYTIGEWRQIDDEEYEKIYKSPTDVKKVDGIKIKDNEYIKDQVKNIACPLCNKSIKDGQRIKIAMSSLFRNKFGQLEKRTCHEHCIARLLKKVGFTKFDYFVDFVIISNIIILPFICLPSKAAVITSPVLAIGYLFFEIILRLVK